MQTPSLEVTQKGSVRWLTLQRPATLNALTEELVATLAENIQRAAQDPGVRVGVVRGSGGNFCSGLDLKASLPDSLTLAEAEEKLATFQNAIRAITRADKPFIACVEGAAVGFGADLALACDLRVFGRGAYLQEKFVDIGLMPDGGGTFWLPHMVGLGRALELLMLGDRVEAERALSLGLANSVASEADASAATQQLAERLCQKAPLALAAIKSATRMALDDALENALDREKVGQAKLLASSDFREGVQAWVERRPPNFRGE